MRQLVLPAVIVLVLLSYATAQEHGQAAQSQPGTASPAVVDWADCRACHAEMLDQFPPLSAFRPSAPSAPVADCSDCHEPLDLTAIRREWTHPVRSIASHLACTDCHVVVEHGAAQPPPRPQGDFLAAGCYECHRGVELQSSLLWSHGRDPRVACRDCHPAHQPLRAALPPELLPRELRSYWQEHGDWWISNDACFTCHPPVAMMFRLDAGFVTLNTTNYHETHVLRGQVLCVECHDPHGSNRQGMLRDTLLTGDHFAFLEQIDGGSCAVICHDVDHQNWRYVNTVF